MTARIEIKQGAGLNHPIGIKLDDTLITYTDLVSPVAKMRLKSEERANAVTIGIAADAVTDPTKYNARLTTTAGQTDVPGEYIVEIDATVSGVAVTIPSAKGDFIEVGIGGDVG